MEERWYDVSEGFSGDCGSTPPPLPIRHACYEQPSSPKVSQSLVSASLVATLARGGWANTQILLGVVWYVINTNLTSKKKLTVMDFIRENTRAAMAV